MRQSSRRVKKPEAGSRKLELDMRLGRGNGKNPRIIGITGGAGSGKSAVAHVLAELGVRVIDADMIAREVVSKGQRALDEIVSCFGGDVLTAGGELDRRRLRSIVFQDREKLEKLNRITHKYITQRIMDKIYDQSRGPVIAIDAAIPFKNGFLDIADEVWVVTAAHDTRIKRIMDRDNVAFEDARSLVDAQMKEADYIEIADRVLFNDNDMESMRKLVWEEFEIFMKR